MALIWLLCDLKSGDVWNELPLRTTGDLERTVGAKTTLGVNLDINDEACPANWVELINPSRAMLVAVDDGRPIAAYIMDSDTAGEPSASLTLASIEACLDNVYVRDHDFSEGVDDEATAAATLCSDILTDSYGFALAVTPTGKTGDHSYAFAEDRTVFMALNDLMAAEGGPEWTVRLTWFDENKKDRLIKTIHIGPNVGYILPSVVVENVHMVSRLRKRDSSRGNRATYVIATSDGSGPSRPMSSAYVDQEALDAGVPQWEVRVPTTAIDDPVQLDRIAAAGLERRRLSVRTWEMVLSPTKPGCPRVGRDFDAGDTVQVESGAMQFDSATLSGMQRIIGWRASVQGDQITTVTPVFWQAPEKDVS